jgi:hypothetical protein
LPFVGDLMDVVNRHVLMGFSGTVPVGYRQDYRSAYKQGLIECFTLINDSKLVPKDEDIMLFFEKGDGLGPVAQKLLNELAVYQDGRRWSRFVSHAYVPKDQPPCQAADILAWERMRTARERLLAAQPDLTVKAITAMIDGAHVQAIEWDQMAFRWAINELRAGREV